MCPSPVQRLLVHNPTSDEELILFLAGGFSPGIFWLGGTDVQIEGEWVWTGNVQAMGSYKNWAPGEPNNANGNEHCLEMDMGGQYQWNDNNCENRFNFICEIPYESCILIYLHFSVSLPVITLSIDFVLYNP